MILNFVFRFLATGESYRSLSFSYRLGIATISKIVAEVCQCIWIKFQPIYLQIPNSSTAWLKIAEQFNSKWQFPNCIGALDGKHIILRAPPNSGSLHYNYKGSFSTVLLALVDANYRFIYIDVGSYGRNSDGGIFSQSSLGRAMAGNKLKLPSDSPLPNASELGSMPYVILADEAFPLQTHIMRPYPRRGLSREQQAFNYRLSRGRRVVENVFGIMAARWRVFHTKIGVKPDTVNDIVKACCVLHNMVQRTSDTPDVTSKHSPNRNALIPLQHIGNRPAEESFDVRDKFKTYLAHHPLSWQNAYLDRGLTE